VVRIDNDKAVAWLRKGAQPTERVEQLLKISGAWEQFKPGSGPAPAAPAPAAPVPAAPVPAAEVAPASAS
jgi:small subunit ribosomal protein S16